MVLARFFLRGIDVIEKIEISGHAQSTKTGNDLICAAISAQVSLLEVGALFYEKEVEIEKSSGFFSLTNSYTPEVQGILKSLHLCLNALEKDFSEYIEVRDIFEMEDVWQQKKVVDPVKMEGIVNPNA